MSVVVHVQPRPNVVTELPIADLRAQVTYTPGVRLTDHNTVTLAAVYAEDEPTYLDYQGYIEGGVDGHQVGDTARIAVTARRVIICAYESFKPKGQILVVSIDREDLRPVTEVPARKRNKPGAAAITAPGVDLRVTLPSDRTALLVAALQPSAVDSMGAEAHSEREAREREAEQERLAKINEHAAEVRRQIAEEEQRKAQRSTLSVGLLDHRKTWQYTVSASVEQCVQAFVEAFHGRGGAFMNGRWEIELDDDGATAVYGGRRGLMGVATAMSRRAQGEQDSAVGTRVRFTAGESPSGKAVCTLRLQTRGTTFGLTSDARFIRPHFHAVTARLRELDSDVEIRSS